MYVDIFYDDKSDLKKVFSRSQLDSMEIKDKVNLIVYDVKKRGDKAVIDWSEKFDGKFDGFTVSEKEIEEAYKEVSPELLESLRKAKKNILDYHYKQIRNDSILVDEKGNKTGFVMRPVESCGIYVPGGLASYPSSVLMCALPAVAAGVENIYMVTPFKDGKANPLTLVAAKECGVKTVYKIGGAQAIAALAFGTESVKKVDVITGPGNIYVTLAKKEVYGNVGIDMIAGPSEILVVADGSVPAEFCANDMLSQAEHDKMAASITVTTNEVYAKEVQACVEKLVDKLPKSDIVKTSLKANGAIIVVKDMARAIDVANKIAPEHLELLVKDPEAIAKNIKNAGAIFMGAYSPEPLGDYFAGPNHVLPTSGTAKYFAALSSDNYMKKISIIDYTKESLLNVSDDIIRLAECEGLMAHANSIRIRSKKYENS